MQSYAQPVMTVYDLPMWDSIGRERMALQKCGRCGAFRYPPGPICAECHALDYSWEALSGTGRILSWVVFHRQYFEDFPPPYNAIAVRLAEGPIVISNLVGPEPEGSWIDAPVTMTYRRHRDRTQHAFRLDDGRAGTHARSDHA
jgi:uncharacterized OB-fold protein